MPFWTESVQLDVVCRLTRPTTVRIIGVYGRGPTSVHIEGMASVDGEGRSPH
jgi:hypothetical protein